MKEIHLFCNEHKIGTLTKNEHLYCFKVNFEELENERKNGNFSKIFNFEKEIYESLTMIDFFEEFVPVGNQHILKKMFDINPEDDDFEKLYKSADFTPDNHLLYLKTNRLL